MKKIGCFLFLVSLLVALVAPGFASAQDVLSVETVTNVTSVSQLYALVNKVVRVIYVIFFLVAAVYIIMGAFDYLQSGGKEDKTKEARQNLIYAMVALGVALLSYGVGQLVRSFITS